MHQPYTLIIPSWYPTAQQPLTGIFIEKHVQMISGFVDVVVMYIKESEKESMQEEKVSDAYMKYTYCYEPSSSRLVNQLKYILAQWRAYGHITRKYGKPSMLHLQVVFPAGIFVYLLLLFKNIPLVITEHWSGYTDEDGRYARQSPLFKHLTKALFKKAAKISVVSGYLRKAIIKQNLTAENKISIVSNILHIPDTPSISGVQPPKALFIGHLNDHEKNISMLIAAVEIVAQKYPDFRLTLIGGGDESEKFIHMARDKGRLDKTIHVAGYVPNTELSSYYLANNFFILTSNFETFNIAAAEAMLYGLPVVATRCGGPEEFVNDYTGIWINENNPKSTAAAIIEMIEKRGIFDSVAIATDMKNKYGYDIILKQLKALYDIK
jgi:glycosyltransferase involved in cell wall biosynthesis